MEYRSVLMLLIAVIILSQPVPGLSGSDDGAMEKKYFAIERGAQEIVILVDHYRVPCVDPRPKLCYLVAKAENPSEYPYFYGEIKGFQYQWGHEYRLRVAQEQNSYRLIEVLSDNKRVAKNRFGISLKLPLNAPFFTVDDSSDVYLIGGVKIVFADPKLKARLIGLRRMAGSGDSISGDFKHTQDKAGNTIMLTSISFEKN
ncbi:MAG: DUF4377 domain-containing protein [Blastocatellia bacterium]|nr:DUF4377 domain-containing protein [Blastocatellia bacterium]